MASDSESNDSEIAAQALAVELEDYSRAINRAILAATITEQLQASETAGTLAVALSRLSDKLHTDPIDHDLLELGRRTAAVMEKLDAPIARVRDSLSGRERTRHLQDLQMRIRHLMSLAEEIGQSCERSALGGRECEFMRATARGIVVNNAGRQLDERISRLEEAIAQNRDNEERRHWRFDSKIKEIDEATSAIVESVNIGVDGRIQNATAHFDSLSTQLEKRLQEQEQGVNAELVSKLSKERRDARQKESRAADTWRRIAVLFGSAGLLALLLAIWRAGSSASAQTLLAHAGITIVCGGLATYCARQSAEHRREERTLRENQMRLADSVNILFDMSPVVREELTRGLVESIIRERARENTDLSAAALSVIPVEKLAQLLRSLPSPGSGASENVIRSEEDDKLIDRDETR